MKNLWLVGVVTFALAAGAALAADKKKPRYTDPEKADADFAIQGEYTGKLGGETKLGEVHCGNTSRSNRSEPKPSTAGGCGDDGHPE